MKSIYNYDQLRPLSDEELLHCQSLGGGVGWGDIFIGLFIGVVWTTIFQNRINQGWAYIRDMVRANFSMMSRRAMAERLINQNQAQIRQFAQDLEAAYTDAEIDAMMSSSRYNY